MLREFEVVLSGGTGRTGLVKHDIDVKGSKPIRLSPYRVPQMYRGWMREELDRMSEDGIIEESVSPWGAPVVLVKKKDGSLRFCIDYRRLNEKTDLDAYPMPRIEELIDGLGGAQYLTTIDLARGYWQVPMADKAKELTVFVTPYGLFQFKVMPFGLNGAPAMFQRLMDRVIQGMSEYTVAYLDDLVVNSATWKDHLEHVRQVLVRLRESGLTAKPDKCQFGMKHCRYLGYVVGGGEVRPEVAKVEAVKKWKRPRTKKEVRMFLGLSGYYRRFIPQYSVIAAVLTDLTRKDRPKLVRWTEECEDAFERLKEVLCNDPVLKSPDYSREFTVQTDASDRGMGAVLCQTNKDGEEHPVAYFSRKFLPREERYGTVEKECLAIKLRIQAFRVHILGRSFTVVTDHRALEWMNRMKQDNSRLTRWSLSLQPYTFQVKYRPGKTHGNVDALSRREEREDDPKSSMTTSSRERGKEM